MSPGLRVLAVSGENPPNSVYNILAQQAASASRLWLPVAEQVSGRALSNCWLRSAGKGQTRLRQSDEVDVAGFERQVGGHPHQ